jgi:regulator of protease activity HflC (stomatin/prohibitin superfamily)
MLNVRRIFAFLGKVLLAAAVLLGPLFVLAALPELLKEQISLRNILRNMLPGILAEFVAFFLASRFITSLYELRSWREGAGHIVRCALGRPSFPPFVIASGGRITASNDHILMRIGGPGGILTHADNAVVLEQGGRLTRVIGPGNFAQLGPFEKVHDVVDVRPMRWEYKVAALSKEGIPVTVYADVTFQIDTGKNTPTEAKPYPASDDAVFTASTCRWMRAPGGSEDDQYFDWARRVVIGNTEGDLRSIIARYPLDALVGLEEIPNAARQALPEGEKLESARQAIQKELEQMLQGASNLGVRINSVRLGAIKVDDRVVEQWFEAWRKKGQYGALVQERTGEVAREQLHKAARAQAQVDMITAMARAFQQSSSKDARIPSQLLVMRLIEVFDHLRVGPFTYLPVQAIETLERLWDLV